MHPNHLAVVVYGVWNEFFIFSGQRMCKYEIIISSADAFLMSSQLSSVPLPCGINVWKNLPIFKCNLFSSTLHNYVLKTVYIVTRRCLGRICNFLMIWTRRSGQHLFCLSSSRELQPQAPSCNEIMAEQVLFFSKQREKRQGEKGQGKKRFCRNQRWTRW